MKSIELTEEHKVKLLEMCKVLFPESKYWWEYEMYGRALKQNFNDVLAVAETLNPPINIGTKEKPWMQTTSYYNIHWFEFCLLHLSEKIYKSFFKLGEKDNWYGCHLSWAINSMYTQNTNKVHLVDYLYEEFKKLK
jgi:hypothetical protein